MTRAVAALLAVGAGLALVGCGSAKDARRRAVNRYVDRVNVVEKQAATAWTEAESAYTSLGRGPIRSKELRRLAAAPRTIRALRRSVAAVAAPAPAVPLRRSLLRLLDADARFADELGAFGRYVVAVGTLEQRLRGDTIGLHAALKRKTTRAAEERALDRYSLQLDGLARRLAALRSPAALAPWDREQLARVATLRSGAEGLRRGLAAGDRTAANRGLALLRSAASGFAVTPADRAAISAYDRRLVQLRALAAAVARQQQALTRELT